MPAAAAAVVAGVAEEDALVVFSPSGRRGRFPIGTPVLQAARTLGVDIDSVCGGRGLCGRCQVLVSEGEFPKYGLESRADHLTRFSQTEDDYAAQVGKLDAGRRLSCSTRVLGDVVIDVPPDSQVHKQIVRKDPGSYDIEVDPAVRVYYTEVQEPSMHDPSGDLRRLLEALDFEWRLEHIRRCDLRVLQDIQPALRKGDWAVSVAVHNENEITAVWPGFFDRIYGLAVDIGSTTVAAHLVEMASGEVVASAGVMNPQIRFGEDLMSRVSYIMMNPGGEVDLTRAVREALDGLTRDVCADAGVDPQAVMEVTFVGNPVMHHLLLGINPIELGGAPFALATDAGTTVWASELDIRVHKNARAYTLPCIAGHVGADTAGVVLSEKPYMRDEMTLLVDVGTNAEIVLGNRKQLMACSSPTGPAFEGAQIASGQRAANGAIERVRIDPETKEARFKVIGCDLWSNDDGFEEAVAEVGVNGICGSGIIEVIAEMYLARIINQDGVVDGRLAERSDRVVAEGRTWSYILWRGWNTIKITQNDVRAIQLGKAALYAGVRLLMDRMRVERIERIRLAGAFGNHIDVKYAMILGLIPDCDLQQVSSAGNAAGVGARIALLDRKGRREIESVVRQIEKVETAIEPKFQEHFVEAMAIPHKTAAFSNLRAAVSLPEVDHSAQAEVSSGSGGPGTRRRRRRR